MQDFFDQIRVSLNHNLYYLALFGSLAVPDICGAMSSQDGESNKYRYQKCFDKYFPSTYIFFEEEFESCINSKDCYYFRCSMLHQGSSQHPKAKYSRYIFVENPKLYAYCNVIDDALNIDITTFCNSMLQGAKQWLQEDEKQEIYKKTLVNS